MICKFVLQEFHAATTATTATALPSPAAPPGASWPVSATDSRWHHPWDTGSGPQVLPALAPPRPWDTVPASSATAPATDPPQPCVAPTLCLQCGAATDRQRTVVSDCLLSFLFFSCVSVVVGGKVEWEGISSAEIRRECVHAKTNTHTHTHTEESKSAV